VSLQGASAGFTDDASKPLVYEALADLNRHFQQVLEDLERLREMGLFPRGVARRSVRTCQATLEETRAWANFEFVEILHQREERDWARFARDRQKGDRALKDPDNAKPERRIPGPRKKRLK
jgi:hypothetical protein